jgi:hypothetical protein
VAAEKGREEINRMEPQLEIPPAFIGHQGIKEARTYVIDHAPHALISGRLNAAI